MDRIAVLANPKYQHIKDTFERLDKLIKSFDEEEKYTVKKIKHCRHYLEHMMKTRKHVQDLLKAHKNFKALELGVKKNDPVYGEIPAGTLKALVGLAKPRMKDLRHALKTINRLLQNMRNDPGFENKTRQTKNYAKLLEHKRNICCLLKQLSEDSYKIVQPRIYSRIERDCEKKINIYETPKPNMPESRTLMFCYDNHTLRLSYPKFRTILQAQQQFKQLRLKYQESIATFCQLKHEEIKRITTEIEKLDSKINFLQNLLDSIIVQDKKKYIPNKGIDSGFKKKWTLKSSKIILTYPKRKTLEDAVQTYEKVLLKLRKSGQSGLVQYASNNVKPYLERVARNYLVTQKMLQLIPNIKKHCDYENKKAYKKHKGILKNLEKTKKLALPKLSILENALESQSKTLKNHQQDLTKPVSLTEIENQQKRLDQLIDLIEEKKKVIASLMDQHCRCFIQNVSSNVSTYPPTRFIMSQARTPVCNSKPKIKLIECSYKRYEEWITGRLNDIKHKEHLEILLKQLQSHCEDCQFENDFISRHTLHMVQNKLKLEDILKSIETKEDFHTRAHKKLDERAEKANTKPKILQKLVKNRSNLTEPRRIVLRHTVMNFSHLMSEIKQKRILCELNCSVLSPEQIENNLFRSSYELKQPKYKSRSVKAENLSKLFSKIHQADPSVLEKVIKRSLLDALNDSGF